MLNKVQTNTSTDKNKRHKYAGLIDGARKEKKVCGSAFEQMLAEGMREEHGKEVRRSEDGRN